METFWGDLLALTGAVAGAFYLMIGRHLRGKISLTPYVFLVYSAAALFLVIAMLILDGIPPIFPTQVYFWLLLLGGQLEDKHLGMEMDAPIMDFCKMAESMGVNGNRVSRPDELDGALRSALDSGRPSLVEVCL